MQEVLARLAERFAVQVEEVVVTEERVAFKLPAALAAGAAAADDPEPPRRRPVPAAP